MSPVDAMTQFIRTLSERTCALDFGSSYYWRWFTEGAPGSHDESF